VSRNGKAGSHVSPGDPSGERKPHSGMLNEVRHACHTNWVLTYD
jgi:hypothetical protein